MIIVDIFVTNMINNGKMEKTALIPLIDLAVDIDVPNTALILERLINKKKRETSGKAYLAESRYKGSEAIIKLNKYKQVLELGSGFTPHAINLGKVIEKYIEVDYPSNLVVKEKLINKIFKGKNNNTSYIAGDIFTNLVWRKISRELLKGRIGIFAEGFMQYTNKKQRAFLLKKIKVILIKNKGSFFFEDSLTFHPEFPNTATFKDLTKKMSQISGNNNLLKYISQEDLTKEFKDFGFKIKRIKAYSNLMSKSYNTKEAKFIIKNFKHWQLSL